tara:strand:- start:57 stop:212 length:156 start_codon:yes stop_codon:yes gene_type:complete
MIEVLPFNKPPMVDILLPARQHLSMMELGGGDVWLIKTDSDGNSLQIVLPD